LTEHIKRLAYACVAIGLIALALFRRSIGGFPIPMWRRVLVLAGGLFFLYVATMYYFPKYRKRRAELDALLDEAEKEERERNRQG